MQKLFVLSLVAVTLSAMSGAPTRTDLEVQFEGRTLSGTEIKTEPTKATILIFHQAMGNFEGEYANIVPRILSAGYTVIGYDMPGGGNGFGATNQTMASNPDWEITDYCGLYPHFEAVVQAEADRTNGPLILWGSSYSAALVVQAAAKNPAMVEGVIAFSPPAADPMAHCRPALYMEDYTIPTLVMRPEGELEYPPNAEQAEVLPGYGVQLEIVPGAVHAASMLNPERQNENTEAPWASVLMFLESLAD